MIKIVLVMFSVLFLASCTPGYNDNTGSYKLPTELQDCKIFELNGGAGNLTTLYVVRCPNSSVTTTSSCGKNCERSVTFN